MSIPKALYEQVRQRAQFRCEYCHYPTPTGRATCNRLDLKDERRAEQFIQKSRQQWVESGLHPPGDDPQQSG